MKNSIIKDKKFSRTVLIIIIWLAIWEMVSLFVNNSILIVGPDEVLVTLYHKLFEADFYLSVFGSLSKILLGFLIGALSGLILAILAYNYELVDDLLMPFMAFIKSVPVASFVVLFLIWWNKEYLSMAICILVVLPQIYLSVLSGLKNTDVKLKEMADVMGLRNLDRIHYIYRPSVCEHLEPAFKISIGMSFKAGIAAEVIGTPDYTIGSGLYISKIYLDTAGVLAWTVTIIVLSVICEKILMYLLNRYSLYEFACQGIEGKQSVTAPSADPYARISIYNLTKLYSERMVLGNYTAEFVKGERYGFDWKSGSGKTTLFRLIAGLEKADTGSIEPSGYSVSMVFQEDRLVEGFSAIKNVELISGDAGKARSILLRLLSDEDIYKPVRELSGGQKRRVAIARAFAKECDIAIFDEPYEGLDEDSAELVHQAIKEYAPGKIVLTASHIKVRRKQAEVPQIVDQVSDQVIGQVSDQISSQDESMEIPDIDISKLAYSNMQETIQIGDIAQMLEQMGI